MPEVNQIQYHPWMPQEWKELVAWQTAHAIATTAYTSLDGSRFHRQHGGEEYPQVITQLAAKHGATEPQVLLRWALAQGVAVIPGATSEAHISDNLSVPEFYMSEDDMRAVENALPPIAWFDKQRGPSKYTPEDAVEPWSK